MTRILVVGAAFAAMALIVNCSSFTASDASVTSEAGAVETSAPVIDAGAADADPYADCTLLFEDDFPGTAFNPAWIVSPNAQATPSVRDGQAVLVEKNHQYAATAIWRKVSLDAGKDVVVDVTLNDDNLDANSADGFAIAWAPSDVVAVGGTIPVGGDGNGVGICGNAAGPVHTIALAIPTFPVPVNGPRSLHVFQTDNGAECQGPAIEPFALASAMPATVRISQNSFSGTINGATIVATVPHIDIAWLGLTAATGNTSSTESFSALRVHACPPKTH